jgi:hypothetical protein
MKIVGILSRGLVGATLGAAATIPMSAAFFAGQKVGAIGTLPPQRVVEKVSPQLSKSRRRSVATIAHFLIGASAGALYLVAVPRAVRGARSGALFGILVWLVGYEVVMPPAAEMPRAHRDRRPRAITILIAHLVFGASLGRLARRS